MIDNNEWFDTYQEAIAQLPEWTHIFLSADSIWDLLAKNALQAGTFAFLGWLVAWTLERRHNNQMTSREMQLADISVTTAKHAQENTKNGILIYGSVVVAHDFFRTFFIQIRKLIGGNIKAYERLVKRGRREAFIRLKEDARLRGFDKVINVRFTGSHVAGRFISAVELVAYGTGIRTVNKPSD